MKKAIRRQGDKKESIEGDTKKRQNPIRQEKIRKKGETRHGERQTGK